jgi:hypothetical protein
MRYRLSQLRWRIRRASQRYLIAWRYAKGHLTRNGGFSLIQAGAQSDCDS